MGPVIGVLVLGHKLGVGHAAGGLDVGLGAGRHDVGAMLSSQSHVRLLRPKGRHDLTFGCSSTDLAMFLSLPSRPSCSRLWART